MATTYKDMLAAAHAAVPKVTAAEATALVDKAGARRWMFRWRRC